MSTSTRIRRLAARAPLAITLALATCVPMQAQTRLPDPLPSWNEGPTKAAILDFVRRVTTEGGADFVPVEDRIATFDNDGTLWSEKALPTEVYFVLARVRELAASDPSLRQRQPFKAALEGDAAYFHEAGASAIAQLLAATHGGMTQEAFATEVERFLDTGIHPTLGRPYTATAYPPMLELLAYLGANGFQTWISSGGTLDFIRVFAPRVYGIPSERTIGSEISRESRRVGGRLVVWRLGKIEQVNDKEGKPVGIDRHIGKRPVFVAGNVMSGGDVAMMEYSRGRSGPSFQLLVNHDDAVREFAYAEKDGASLRAAATNGFTVVSMKNDWRVIFAEPAPPTRAAIRE